MSLPEKYEIEASKEGKRLIDHWILTQNRRNEAAKDLERTEVDYRNATQQLGKFLVPEDTLEAEVFCTWWGNRMIAAYKIPTTSFYSVKIRKEIS